MALQLPTTGGIRPFLQKDFQCSNYIFQGTYYKCFSTWFQISTDVLNARSDGDDNWPRGYKYKGRRYIFREKNPSENGSLYWISSHRESSSSSLYYYNIVLDYWVHCLHIIVIHKLLSFFSHREMTHWLLTFLFPRYNQMPKQTSMSFLNSHVWY